MQTSLTQKFSKMKNVTAIAILLILMTSSFAAPFSIQPLPLEGQKKEVVLKAGTEIQLESDQYYDGKNLRQNQEVLFRTKYPVIVDEEVLIAAGAPVVGRIIRFEKNRTMGRPGYLEIRIESVTAIDGQQIRLDAPDIMVEGKNRKALSYTMIGVSIIVLWPLLPAGILVKGKPATLESGYVTRARVLSNVPIRID